MKFPNVIPPLIIAAAILGIVAVPVYLGSKKIDRARVQCEAKGGTQVRTYDGLTCIKPDHCPDLRTAPKAKS